MAFEKSLNSTVVVAVVDCDEMRKQPIVAAE